MDNVVDNGAPLKWSHGERRDVIVRALLTDIFQGELHAGQRLVTQELADRFQVSPTPIREALVALAGTGVIDLIPNRGAIVRRVTQAEVREVCQVRKALECEATKLACGRIDLSELDDLAAELRKLKARKRARGEHFVRKARELDSRLHDLIASCCGNRFLARELERLKILFRAFRDVSYVENAARDDFRRLAGEASEHLAVVDALRKGDRMEAARAMARHIRSGVRYWSRALPNAAPDAVAAS